VLRRSTSGEPLTLEVRDVKADGSPGDHVLSAATAPPTSVPEDHPSWVAIDFATSVAVTSGTMYAIVGRSSGAGRYLVNLGPNDYVGGFAWYSHETQPAWAKLSTKELWPDLEEEFYDFAFKTYVVPDHAFGGFAYPIDADMINSAKAGATIPVRWHLESQDGTPVSDSSSFVSVTSKAGNGACAGQPTDAVEDYSGGSGLQYLGDGDWQFNWKAPRSYAGQCRTLILTLSDGSTYTARFQFK